MSDPTQTPATATNPADFRFSGYGKYIAALSKYNSPWPHYKELRDLLDSWERSGSTKTVPYPTLVRVFAGQSYASHFSYGEDASFSHALGNAHKECQYQVLIIPILKRHMPNPSVVDVVGRAFDLTPTFGTCLPLAACEQMVDLHFESFQMLRPDERK